jgi:hypothetical protein
MGWYAITAPYLAAIGDRECCMLPPKSGTHLMSYYRAYIIGRDGHFQSAINPDSADDDAAIESAKHLVDDYDVEVWQQARLVAKLQSQPE